MILTIFDIDGTICDSREVEGICFAKAIERITGKILSTLDWVQYPEPTSSGIVRSLLDGDPAAPQKEAEIKKEYCRLLCDARHRLFWGCTMGFSRESGFACAYDWNRA